MNTGEAISASRGEDVFAEASSPITAGTTTNFDKAAKAIVIESGDVTFTEIILKTKDGSALTHSANYITNAIARPTGTILTFPDPVLISKITWSGGNIQVLNGE